MDDTATVESVAALFAPRPFDAPAHMRKIRTRNGMQDYLDVKWRVAWLRSEFPGAQIITEQIEGDAEHARFKCTITLPNGAVGSGHGSETLQDFPDFYEKAETKAIGRACATLGYGTDAAADFDDGEPMDGLPAAKGERAERAKGHFERGEVNVPVEGPNRPPSPALDGDRPATPGQVKALERFMGDGFDVVAYARKNYGKEALASLTFAEAGAIITAAQKRDK